MIINELKKVKQRYHSRGFQITDMYANKEFEKVRHDILPTRLECCGVDNHVPEIERLIQTIKNETRSSCNTMPYRCVPKIMVKAIVKTANKFLNAFGNGNQFTQGLTARNVMDNLPNVSCNDIKHELGEYVQVHTANNPTNNMKGRTTDAIVLDP